MYVKAYKNSVVCDIFRDKSFLNCVITRACSMHMRDDMCGNSSGKSAVNVRAAVA
jgi:hypothetical protein